MAEMFRLVLHQVIEDLVGELRVGYVHLERTNSCEPLALQI